MSLIDQLNWRYATKQFDSTRQLSEEKLQTLLEALRLSASSFGLQPWHFFVLKNAEIRAQLLEHSWGQKQVTDASEVILFCQPTAFSEADVDAFLEDTMQTRGVSRESLAGYEGMMKGFLDRMEPEVLHGWARNQVYLALGSFLVACAAEGVDACPMEGFQPSEYDRILGLEEKGLTAVVVCPIGYRSEEDKYASLAKVRFPMETVLSVIE
ncbi:MAG: nitroreductase family protein [Verrucomicrobiota bacterium]